jgi:hypothetical protein
MENLKLKPKIKNRKSKIKNGNQESKMGIKN